jgi:ketosteroid isomerase-like protein
LLALWLCALVACGGGEPRPAAPVVGPAVDERKAAKDARGLVAEIYQTIDSGKIDSLFSLLSDPLIVFGPRKLDAMATRADALVALGKVIDPKDKKHAQLRSGGLVVVASEGGHSAWLFDIVNVDGKPLAVTAVLSNTDDLWSVSAAVIAATPNGRQVKAETAKDAIVPPGAASAARIAPGAADAVDRFKKGLVDQQGWGDELASQPDAIVVGPTAGDVARGKDAIKRRWKARMKSNVREATSGEITAARTLDGQLVWLSVPVTQVADDEAPLPLRIFAIYEKDGAGWRMIALHEALAFDEPGSGTAFKKILPPEPAKPEPVKPEPAKPEPAKPEPAAEKPATDKPAATAQVKKKKKRAKTRKPSPPPPPPEPQLEKP